MLEKSNFFIDQLTGCKKHDTFVMDFDGILNNTSVNETLKDVTLVLLDVDGFMHVNQEFGHKVGDDVLKEVGEVLLLIEGEKLVYRYSGDEFAVVFLDKEKEQVFLIMEKIRDTISKSGECLRTSSTVSVGIATYPEDGLKSVDMIRKASDALYRAKTSGRNKVCLAREEKLVAKTSHYTPEQLKRLKMLAEAVNIGEAALMREALDDLLKKYDKQKMFKRSVLVIDDSEFMRMQVKEFLIKAGFHFMGEAHDAKTGIKVFEESNPDYVLLDINMPEMDGIDFLKNIKKKQRNTIIMLAATTQKAAVLDSIKYGADAFVAKPFKAEFLLEVMDNIDNFRLNADKLKSYEKLLKDYQDTDMLSQEIINTLIDMK